MRVPILLTATLLLVSAVPAGTVVAQATAAPPPTGGASDPPGGDLAQLTTSGLLVQRADDSSIAFSDGDQAWVLAQDDVQAGVEVVDAQPKPPAGPQPPIPQPPMAQPAGVEGNATVPATGNAPTVLSTPDDAQIVGTGKPAPPRPPGSATLPANGTLNAPVPLGGAANGHAVSSENATGKQQPLTVDEMRAHGYLGIPRPPSSPTTPNP